MSIQKGIILERDRRAEYVSGFTGSNAEIIITSNKALLWTDGRYYAQAESELDAKLWTIMKTPSAGQWLTLNLPKRSIVAVDPVLISASSFVSLSLILSSNNITLKGIDKNLVDEVWSDQPKEVYNKIEPYGITFSGILSSQKINSLKDSLKEAGAESMIVTSVADVACEQYK